MSSEQSIARLVGEAVHEHRMIAHGDKILVAFSGGKDSFTLLDMLLRLQKKAPVRFEIMAATVDPGFGSDFGRMNQYFLRTGIRHIMVKQDIASLVKQKVKTRDDTGQCCSFCARLRRGVLYKIAREQGCSKIALGHNLDDAIETFLLNMFYVSRLEPMRPRYLAEDNRTSVIRPLIYVPESKISEFAQAKRFPLVKQDCLYQASDSKRAMTKKMVSQLAVKNRYFFSSMKNAMNQALKLKGCDKNKD